MRKFLSGAELLLVEGEAGARSRIYAHRKDAPVTIRRGHARDRRTAFLPAAGDPCAQGAHNRSRRALAAGGAAVRHHLVKNLEIEHCYCGKGLREMLWQSQF